jgi:hypothetical protein
MKANTNTKYMNAKAFYEAHKDVAEVTYAWFVARLKTLHDIDGDSTALFRTGWYYFLEVNGPIFINLLKRGVTGKIVDAQVKLKDVTLLKK